MIDIYTAVTGESVPTGTDWDWMDPGVIAVIGAGSMLGGATRLCLAVTIITVGIFPSGPIAAQPYRKAIYKPLWLSI